MGAMLGAPAEPARGAFKLVGAAPQAPGSAIVRELRTSLLDVQTAVRLGWRGRVRFFGTGTPAPQKFTSPSTSNEDDSIRSSIGSAGVAPRMANKTASSGPRIGRDVGMSARNRRAY